jgi:hypothetical protein
MSDNGRRRLQEGNSLPALEFEVQDERQDSAIRKRAYMPSNLALATGIAGVLFVLLRPPYVTLIQGNQFNAGFHSLFAPPTELSHVNSPLLASVLFGIALLTLMSWAIFRTFETDA